MSALCKVTPTVTVGAWRHENGVAMGILGMGIFVSLEYNPLTQRLELLVMDGRLEECGVTVRHVDRDWNVIQEDSFYEE